jgi:hypothetical protein
MCLRRAPEKYIAGAALDLKYIRLQFCLNQHVDTIAVTVMINELLLPWLFASYCACISN